MAQCPPASCDIAMSRTPTAAKATTATLVDEDNSIADEPHQSGRAASSEVQDQEAAANMDSLQDQEAAANVDTTATICALQARVAALEAEAQRRDEKLESMNSGCKRLGEALIQTQQKLKRRFNVDRWADV